MDVASAENGISWFLQQHDDSHEVCLATDPLSPKFVNQDLFAHVLWDMRIAVSNGDLAEPSLGN